MTSRRTATFCGLAAVLLLSTVVAMIRSVSEYFGPVGGAALLYTASAAFLLAAPGRPRLRNFHPAYLVVGGGLFVAYELCFSQSLGLASNHSQVLDLGIVNYLWPSFTVLFAVPFNGEQPRLLVFIGIVLALYGIVWGVGGSMKVDSAQIWGRIQMNPLSYGLAFAGAVLWGLYCNVTRRWAGGQNGVAFFFALTALALWVRYSLSEESRPLFSEIAALHLALAALCMAGGYALWNQGILRGNLTLLAVVSNFTPIFSSIFIAWLLGVKVPGALWCGAAVVSASSLLCWYATSNTRRPLVDQSRPKAVHS